MQRTIISFIFLFIFSHSFAQGYILSGKINGVDNGWAYVKHRQTGKIDSGRILNGKFTVSGKVTKPEFCNFGLSANNVKDFYFGFFLKKGRLNLKAFKGSLNDTCVFFSGSLLELEFQQFKRRVNAVYQRHSADNKTDADLEKLTRIYSLKHRDSYISAFALISYENNLYQLSRLYATLAPEIQRSYYGQLIKDKLIHR